MPFLIKKTFIIKIPLIISGMKYPFCPFKNNSQFHSGAMAIAWHPPAPETEVLQTETGTWCHSRRRARDAQRASGGPGGPASPLLWQWTSFTFTSPYNCHDGATWEAHYPPDAWMCRGSLGANFSGSDVELKWLQVYAIWFINCYGPHKLIHAKLLWTQMPPYSFWILPVIRNLTVSKR